MAAMAVEPLIEAEVAGSTTAGAESAAGGLSATHGTMVEHALHPTHSKPNRAAVAGEVASSLSQAQFKF